MTRAWATAERRRERAAHLFVGRSAGRPLAHGSRTRMERAFGADFGDVLVHDGRVAAEAALALGARGFTLGDHVVLPDGGHDERLLAHELAHVVQQRAARVPALDAESAARAASERVATGGAVDLGALGAAPSGLYAQDEEPDETRRETRTEPSLTVPWGSLLATPVFGLGQTPLLTPPFAPTRADDQPAPSLPSRLGVLSSGRFSLGLRLGFPEPEDIPGAPPSTLKQSLARAELLDQQLTGRIPGTWEALDKGQLASAVWGIFSTHIAPDVARNLTRSLTSSRGPSGLQLQLDLVLLTDFTGGGLSFTVRH